MTRVLAAVTYADLVPHNRVFGVGRGLFSRGPLSRGIALVCPDVPRTTSNPQLWREGMQVHGAGRTAYTIGKGRRGSARRMVYMINCVDPADTMLIVSGMSRRERRTLSRSITGRWTRTRTCNSCLWARMRTCWPRHGPSRDGTSR